MQFEDVPFDVGALELGDDRLAARDPLGDHPALLLPGAAGDGQGGAQVGVEQHLAGGRLHRGSSLDEQRRGTANRFGEVLHRRLVVGRGAGQGNAAQEPLGLGHHQRRRVLAGLHGHEDGPGLRGAVERQQGRRVLELGPGVGGIEPRGGFRERDCLRPLALLGGHAEQEAMRPHVPGVDLNGVLEVGDGVGGAGFDLALGAEHERLGVERLDHDRRGRLRAGLHAQDHAALRIHLADGNPLIIEDRHGADVGDLELSGELGHRHRFGELHEDRGHGVAVERDLDPVEGLDLPREAGRAIAAAEGLAGAP